MPHYPGVEKVGDRWRFAIYARDPESGRRKKVWSSAIYPTAKGASDARHRAMENAARGVLPGAGDITVKEYLEDHYLRGLRRRGSGVLSTTVDSYEDQVKYVLPIIGGLLLSELTRDIILDLYDELLRGNPRRKRRPLAMNTVLGVHRRLHHAFELAIDADLIVKNPCRNTRPVAGEDDPPARSTTLTVTEALVFLAHIASHRLAAMWHLFLTTGLRRGEIAGLQWPQVDLDAGIVWVQRNRVNARGGAVDRERLKTKRAKAPMKISAETVASLRDHRRRQKEERLAKGPKWVQTDYVFTKANGEPLKPTWILRECAALSLAAEITRVTPQDLRRTVGTVLGDLESEGKISLLGIRDQLRHSASSTVTEANYIKGQKPLNGPAAELLGELFSRRAASDG